jgi:hypothetical protein
MASSGIEFNAMPALVEVAALTDLVLMDVRGIIKDAIEEVAQHLEEEMRANISFRDHSLEDLRAMGHPYARQHLGKGTTGGGRASSLGGLAGHKPWQVHIQEGIIKGTKRGPGLLVDALGIDWAESKWEVAATVGINQSEAFHVEYVVLGTKYMVARDFISGTFLEVVDELNKIFEQISGLSKISVSRGPV